MYGSDRGCTPCSRVREHGRVSPLSNASYLGEPALAKCDLQCARFACALVAEVCGDVADICSCGSHTCAMLVHPAIPICPASRASQCVLSDLLLANGWETCGDALDVVISWLTDHELYTERDLVGLPDIASLSGAQQFSARALACLQQCVKVGALQIIARNTHAHTSWQVANVASEKGVTPRSSDQGPKRGEHRDCSLCLHPAPACRGPVSHSARSSWSTRHWCLSMCVGQSQWKP